MWSVRPATVAFVAGAQCGVLLLVALPVALHALVGHDVALAQGRQAVGIELKRSYYAVGTKNVRGVEEAMHRPTLFDGLDGGSSASRTQGAAR